MGGGAWACTCPRPSRPGASPRGRRSLDPEEAQPPHRRRISAWAEEPTFATQSRRGARAHLRVGGGAGANQKTVYQAEGASPRGRRSREGAHDPAGALGRISAWAEEPSVSGVTPRMMRAHLRVGGGALNAAPRTNVSQGASPRGRRSRVRENGVKTWRWRISAWAEEPRRSRTAGRKGRAHLRVGGGAERRVVEAVRDGGASPRGRRSQAIFRVVCTVDRRISAWAEEPQDVARSAPRDRAHLRVGGGAVYWADETRLEQGASPRGRRSPPLSACIIRRVWRISAWAEEPKSGASETTSFWAHLRVGGGAGISRCSAKGRYGASPRGRRSPVASTPLGVTSGRISAWAEEP